MAAFFVKKHIKNPEKITKFANLKSKKTCSYQNRNSLEEKSWQP